MFEYIKSLFAPTPPVTLMHPQFGLLTHDDGIWSGETLSDGRAVYFCVGGNETEPNTRLLDSLSDALKRFNDIEREALDFILASVNGVERATINFFRDKRPSFAAHDFTFYSLDFLWDVKPQYFVVEFMLEGDADGIWRVEFENGRPFSLGRDD